jgi:hypothetical protein
MPLRGWHPNRAGVLATAAVGVPFGVAAGFAAGWGHAAAAGAGLLLVVSFFLSGQLPLLGAPRRPGTRLFALLVLYTARLALVLLAFRLLSRVGGLDRQVLGVAVLLGAAAWITAYLGSFLRAKIPVVIPDAASPSMTLPPAADRVAEP